MISCAISHDICAARFQFHLSTPGHRHDVDQRVQSYRLTVVPDVPIVEFEDVFGNWASRFEISQPYKELTIAAESTITLSGFDPFAFAHSVRPSFPLVWMPWEHMMLSPYLTPVELPETQLRELLAEK